MRAAAPPRRPAAIAAPRSVLVRTVCACLIAWLGLAQSASAESTVHRLEIEGAEAVPESVLKKSMLTRGPDRWRFWKARPVWSEGVLGEDVARIEQTYRNHGYYTAEVDFEVEERDDGKSADIVFRVVEGEPVRLAAIDLEVDAASPIDAETLISRLPIAVGDVFAVDHYRKGRAAVLEELANLGHPAARLQGGAEVIVEEQAAWIRWRVSAGPAVEFGEVRIEGLERVGEKVVLREIAVREGEPYSSDALERSRNRLLRLQLFRYVSVQPDKRMSRAPASDAAETGPGERAEALASETGQEQTEPEAAGQNEEAKEDEEQSEAATEKPGDDEALGAVSAEAAPPTADPVSDEPLVWPVVVQLDERAPRSISLGAGWASGLGPRGSARWTHRNFLGDARRFVASGAGSPIEQSASMQLLQPYAFGTQMSLTAESGWRRRHRDSYDTNTVDFNIGPRRSLSEFWVLEGFYRFGWTDVRNVTDPTNEVLRAQKGSGLLSGVGVKVRRAEIERPINPRRGTWLQVGVATNLEALGSDFDWMRYDAEGRAYLPLGRTVAAFRVRYQAIQAMGSTSDDEVPLGERLYLGGPNTGRGFPFEELGPLDDEGEPVGGVSSLLVSAEWRIPVWGPFTVVGFVDAGQVSLRTFGFDPDDIGIGTGGGLAISTPIGPIAVYVAYPVRPLQVSQKVRAAISIGHAF